MRRKFAWSDFAQAIAEDKWRLKRARAIESGIFASGKLGLLGRPLRTERKAACDQALEEARVLAQHAQGKGEPYDAIRDFPPELPLIYPTSANFVFSSAAITHLIARDRRLNEARDCAKSA